MAKNKAAVPKKVSFLERFRIPKNDKEHVERLIEATERALVGGDSSLDGFFVQQMERLRKELAVLKRK